MKKPNNYWTKEKCLEVSLRYNSRSEFRKKDASAYRTALKNHWLDEICEHMNFINKYWTVETAKLEALKYTSRTEFQHKSKGAYEFAKRNDILNDICSHMIKIGNKYLRCVYVFEFENNAAYIGLTYNIEKREIDHNRKGPIYKYIKKYNAKYTLIQITDYIKKEEAQIIEEEYIVKYETNGWQILNTKKISTLGGSTIIWTYDKCKEEALKYKHKSDFLKCRGAANSAMNNGWYDEITSHMTIKKTKRNWTTEEVDFLLNNYHKGIKYCALILNKTRASVKSQYQIKKMIFLF